MQTADSRVRETHVCVYGSVRVCVCVCERERERERVSQRVRRPSPEEWP